MGAGTGSVWLERWRDPGVGSTRDLMGMLLRLVSRFCWALSPAMGIDTPVTPLPLGMPVTPPSLDMPVTPQPLACQLPFATGHTSCPSTTGHTSYPLPLGMPVILFVTGQASYPSTTNCCSYLPPLSMIVTPVVSPLFRVCLGLPC